uniref:Uncharacterized protein n=1 Tax=Heterorhabditis bacteriophora TaxID=37862 RepID=A0A1I7W9I1_HETBA
MHMTFYIRNLFTIFKIYAWCTPLYFRSKYLLFKILLLYERVYPYWIYPWWDWRRISVKFLDHNGIFKYCSVSDDLHRRISLQFFGDKEHQRYKTAYFEGYLSNTLIFVPFEKQIVVSCAYFDTITFDATKAIIGDYLDGFYLTIRLRIEVFTYWNGIFSALKLKMSI